MSGLASKLKASNSSSAVVPVNSAKNKQQRKPAKTGLPLYLQRTIKNNTSQKTDSMLFEQKKDQHNKLAQQHAVDSHESEADNMADEFVSRSMSGEQESSSTESTQVSSTTVKVQQKSIAGNKSNDTSPLGKNIGQLARKNKGAGQALPNSSQQALESHFNSDFNQVRIHTDSSANQLTQSAGANAFTLGNDIFFNQGRYDTNSSDGERLLVHELTHVMQQRSGADSEPQFDLMQSLPTSLGGFDINMVTKTAPDTPGMQGTIRFLPDPSGPYSAQIGLIQTVNFTDVGGDTTTPGSPFDWTNVRAAAGVGAEAGRMELMTTGTGVAPEGWMVDANTAGQARTENVGPNYIEHWTSPSNQFGWLRSPTDVEPTTLADYPRTPYDLDFDFETVAKATDTQAIYGALTWGFGTRSGAVQNEYVEAFDTESATFNEALERFRGYYTHEPIVLYFDTNIAVPIAGEEAKITGVLDYLNRYPDVQIRIDGHADERGSTRLNENLAEQRALSVQSIATSMGIDSSRIEWATGWGETTEFSPRGGANEGSWRANRRVVMSFVRTASTPIVAP